MTAAAPENAAIEPPAERISVLGGALLLGTSTLVQFAASMLVGILVSRTLGPEGKGQLALLQQVPGIAALLLGLGFGTANSYFVGRRRNTPAEALSDSIAVDVALTSLGMAATVVAMRLLVPALNSVPTTVVALSVLTIPFVVLAGHAAGILVGVGRVRGQAVSQVLAAATSLGIVALWFVRDSLTLTIVIVAGVIGAAVSAVSMVVSVKAGRLSAPSMSRIRAKWAYARQSYVTTITGYLETRQDILLLGMLSSASAVGIYSVAVSVSEALWYLPQATMAPLMSRSLQEESASGAEVTSRVTRVIAAFLALTAGILALVMRPLVVWLFGPGFAPAASVFWLLAPGIVVVGVSSQLQAYLSAHGRLYPRMTTAMLLLNLGLNVALIPSLSYHGAALATAISYTLGGGYIVREYLRHTGSRLSDVAVVRGADVRALAGAISARLGR